MFTLDDLKATLKLNDLYKIKRSLDQNPGFLESVDDLGSTLLQWLIRDHDNEGIEDWEEIIEFLLTHYKYEIDINQASQEGMTALHEAVICQEAELVKLLLENGAQIKANEKGDTPLHFAANRNATKITEILIDHGADVQAKNSEGDTPAHLAAAENDNTSTLNLLLEKAPDPYTLLLTQNNEYNTVFRILMDRNDLPENNKSQWIQIVLLQNPNHPIPEPIQQNPNGGLSNQWHGYKSEIEALKNEQITPITRLYDLIKTIDLDTLPIDDLNETNFRSLLTLAEKYPLYRKNLTQNIEKIDYVKYLKNKKIRETRYSLYDICQENNPLKLGTIFSNPEIRKGVRGHLDSFENAGSSNAVSLSYQNKLNNTLEKHMETGVTLNNSLKNIIDDINNGDERGGLLPNEMKLKILSCLEPDKLDEISKDILREKTVTEKKTMTTISKPRLSNNNLFSCKNNNKRSFSHSDSGEKPPKKMQQFYR